MTADLLRESEHRGALAAAAVTEAYGPPGTRVTFTGREAGGDGLDPIVFGYYRKASVLDAGYGLPC